MSAICERMLLGNWGILDSKDLLGAGGRTEACDTGWGGSLQDGTGDGFNKTVGSNENSRLTDSTRAGGGSGGMPESKMGVGSRKGLWEMRQNITHRTANKAKIN